MKIPANRAAVVPALLVMLVLGVGSAGAGPALGSGTAVRQGSGITSGPGSGMEAGPISGMTPGPGPGMAAGEWSWPLNPRPAVVRAFDPPARPWLSGHRGVDLQAGFDGAPVTSPAAGTVSFVGVVVDRPVITIDHGNGLRSSFEAVRSDLTSGDAVAERDVLGWIQPGHCRPGPCVHWGVRRGADYLNPLAFVTNLRPSVLLPPVDPAPG
ncbi:M23 family metallopeptidase [Arthrobacter sp. U41]|uniref:M23 family metallopeptidase n=1 Tax=Arthrobacter sp. U41 TaxID=1849032 RepID=UPI0021B65A91|nr:M23 family metallopeptidase [Arthrobacter sp. U41]